MARIRVENHTNLVRDTNSNAIVNVSKSEYQLYMKRVRSRNSQSDELRGAIREINTLKQDFFEIKKLLKESPVELQAIGIGHDVKIGRAHV